MSGSPMLMVIIEQRRFPMKIRTSAWLFAAAGFSVLAALPIGTAQTVPNNSTTYLLFYRTMDASTSAMAQVAKAHAGRHQVGCSLINLADPTQKQLVDQYEVGRAPMPLLLAVHTNGAVSGAFVSKVTDAELDTCLLSPTKAQCIKLLQQNQLVVLCVQTSPQQIIPPGVRQFQADPHFAKRTQVLTMQINDPNEASFIKDLKIDPRSPACTVLFAPPGVMVGTFAPSASGNDMAKAITATGKCCDDPNCKHHQK